MRLTAKTARRIGIALGFLLVAGVAAWIYVIPAVVVRAIESKYRGRVAIGGVWVGRASAGIRGLILAEGKEPNSPVWFQADEVSTDVSLGSILRGSFSPTVVQVRSPTVRLRIDAAGKPITRIPLVQSARSEKALPEVTVEGGRVVIDQADRPTFELGNIRANLDNGPDHATLNARSDDPAWGRLTVTGRFTPNFESGRIAMRTGPGFTADAGKTAKLPFVPDELWQHVSPEGPLSVGLDVTIDTKAVEPVDVKARVNLEKTSARFPTLGLTTSDTTGELTFDRGIVTLQSIQGRSIGGRVNAKGTLDFRTPNPLFQIQLGLNDVDVSKTPASWGLGELEATGKLKGDVALRVRVRGKSVDLAGTTGEAEIVAGSLQGIPIKSLKLSVQGSGNGIQYQTRNPQTGQMMPLTRLERSALLALTEGVTGTATQKPQQPPSPARPPSFRLPKTLSTSLELEDVDIGTLIGRAELVSGWTVPWSITGRVSVKVEATIPIGALKDFRAYTFRGKATLNHTTVNDFDIGRLDAGVDLAEGVLTLTDLRGIIADHPDPGAMPPDALPMEAVPRDGALPQGGFRGTLRAEIVPKGGIRAKFEANRLPLMELAHLAGHDERQLRGYLSTNLEATGAVETAADPAAWQLSGSVESREISYQKAQLDAIMGRVALKAGRLTVERLSARLAGQPLEASGDLDLALPRRFHMRLDVKGWELDRSIELARLLPERFPVVGRLDAAAEASGELEPLTIRTVGKARVAGAAVSGVSLGDVTASWKTEGDRVRVEDLTASPSGGTLKAVASLPTRVMQGPLEAAATLRNVEIGPLTKLFPEQPMELTGRVDGNARVDQAGPDAPLIAKASLRSAAMTIRGIAATNAAIDLEAKGGEGKYVLAADSLGGRIQVEGTAPVRLAAAVEPAANALVRVSGVGVSRLAQSLGMPPGMAQLHGSAGLLANVRIPLEKPDVYTRGYLNLRDVSWAREFALGTLNATFTRSPRFWRLDDVKGEMFGGAVAGTLWSEQAADTPVLDALDGVPFLDDDAADATPTPLRAALSNPERARFDFRVDRASLARALAFDPALARNVEGTGTLRLRGRLGDTLTATAELDVHRARVFGLPLTDVRIPGELTVYPSNGSGSYQTQRASARFAGGRVQGVIRGRIGSSRSFQLDVPFSDVDLEAFSRIATEARRPASGRLAGKLTLNGPDLSMPEKYRGRLDAELFDASLFEMPVFREIGRFLGASSSGLFERGRFRSSIQNRNLVVERLALEGRLVQMHATGTVGFDGGLNLEVLVNTSEIISQSGQALIGIIPGLRQALGRDAEAMLRLTNYFSNRLLKFRVTGTLRNPSVAIDPAVAITEAATGFFAGVFKLPVNLIR